ncbi:MAG: FKBP-type peptidyl-prolyl cis-trans isomerase [Planctomycetota bacterium]
MRHNLLSLVLVTLLAACGESQSRDIPETSETKEASMKKYPDGTAQSQQPAGSEPKFKTASDNEPVVSSSSWTRVNSESDWSADIADKVQVVVREEGQGPLVKPGDLVKVHYHGLTFNGGQRGQVFDSSRERGESVSFPVGKGRLITGWDKVIPGFKVGSKLTLMIPPSMGYGNKDMGKIKPGSTLLFEIDILDSATPPEAPIFPKLEDGDGRWNTLPSGLKILTLREGKGDKPAQGSNVKVHYSGWLADGTSFDSSYERGDPIQFPVGTGQVIPGWDEGIMALKKGSKAILKIPANLAYGANGAGPIPPNSTLVFQVELLD